MSNTLEDSENLGLKAKLSFLAKDSFIYGGAVAINALLMLLIVPLLTRNFSVEDYGIIDFFSSVLLFIVVLFVFGQDSAVARFFFEYKKKEKKQQLITQSFLLQTFLMLIFLPILWYISDNILESEKSSDILKLVLLQVPFFLLINFSQNILKWTFLRKQFIIISVGSMALSLIVLYVGIIYYKIDITGVFLLYLSVRLIFGLLGLWFVRDWLVYPNDWSFLKEMIPYALPYGIIAIISIGVPIVERSFILEYLTKYDLGLYAVGLKVALIIALPIQAFQMAWAPFFLSIFKDKNARITYNWVLKFFSIFIFTAVLFVTLFSNFFINLLASEDYSGASVVIFAMSMGLAIQSTGWITEIGIDLSKKSFLKFYGFFPSFLISIFVTYILIQKIGLAGASWGVLLGYLTKTIIDSYLAERVFPLKWDYKGVIILGLFTLIIGIISNILRIYDINKVANILIVLSMFLIPFLSWIFIFSKDDREKIKTSFFHNTKKF